MNWFTHIHPEKLSQIVLSYGYCSTLILEQEEPHDCGNAEAMEPNVYRRAEALNDDDDACMYVHGDDFKVELRIDVFQNAKVMSEHKVDIEVSTIIALGQNTGANIVKQLSSWRSAGITWVRLEHSRAAALTLERAKAIALQSISYSVGWTLPTTSTKQTALDTRG